MEEDIEDMGTDEEEELMEVTLTICALLWLLLRCYLRGGGSAYVLLMFVFLLFSFVCFGFCFRKNMRICKAFHMADFA